MNPDSFNKVFIGSGLMAEMLLHTLIHHKGESPKDFYVLGREVERCKQLMQKYNIQATTNFNAFVAKAKVVVLAVDVDKIQDIPIIVEKIREKVPPNALINSVTPNLKISEIEKFFPNHPVMRLGINLSAISGNNIGSYICGSVTPEDTKPVAQFLMDTFGDFIECKDEEEFEKICTIIHAISCGNYLSFNCILDSLIKLGLNAEQSLKIVSCVYKGTAETFNKKFNDDILERSFEYEDVLNEGLKSMLEFGIVQSIDDATHLSDEELKKYLGEVLYKVREFEKEKFEFHYKNW